jgi:CheY-like chemotaxis protein
MLNTIQGAAERGAELVKQVVTFARGAEGERVVLQLRHLLRELERIVAETFPPTIKVSLQVPADLWTVSGDATQLHQVLLNLCVNARDAMPQGGRLSLQADNVALSGPALSALGLGAPGPYVRLSVGDTGTGIASDLAERIFEPFFTTKEVGKGSGLGLSTSLTIVKSHGGALTVDSGTGRGATFYVHLPASLGSPPADAPAEQLPAGSGQRVLVVDDEASVRELTRETLESHGYAVEPAADGADAVARFAQAGGRIDLVLTDLRMPILEGGATVRALRRIDPAVKAIVMTGSSDPPEQLDMGDGTTFVRVLRKPYTASQLLNIVASVLGSRS